MVTVWDAQGIILIDYLQRGQIIIREYYAALLSRLHGKLRTERPKLAHKICFHEDNAPAHIFAISMAKVHELGFKLSPHPPYSPDLTLADSLLFQNFKICLGERDFCLMRRLSPLWMSILKALKHTTFPRG